MKSLVEFIKENLNISDIKENLEINEQLETVQFNKIHSQIVKFKKEQLVDIKKGLSKFSDEDLQKLADAAYTEIGNYKDPDAMFNAYDKDELENLSKLEQEIKRSNNNKEVDIDMLIDVIGILSLGKNLQYAITEIAKKI